MLQEGKWELLGLADASHKSTRIGGGLSSDGAQSFGDPSADRIVVALESSLAGPLQTPIHGAEDAPHVAGAIPHTSHALDHDGDSWQSPQIGGKTMSARTFTQGEINPLPVRRIELGRTPRSLGSVEPIHSALLPLRVPVTCALPADLKEPSYLRHDLTRSEKLGSAPPSLLQTFEVSSSATLQPHEGMPHRETALVALFCEDQQARKV